MKGLIVSIAAVALLLTTAIAGYSLNSNDGSNIYTNNCASCHGVMNSLALSNSTSFKVVSATAIRITSAFNHHTSMKNSILSTNTSITLGYRAALKGKLSAAQKNAIVAALQIQHGEDLYNEQITVNGSNWSCSNILCHGPYGSSDIPGATFGKIVNSFKQNKLKNRQMPPFKTKYTLSGLHLIAKALAVAPTGGTTSVDGATLYYMECMPCHNGPINQSVVTDSAIGKVAGAGSASAGATLITNAINTNAGNGTALGGMGTQVLMNLTPADIQGIATAIQTNQLPANLNIYSSPSCFGTGTCSTIPVNTCHQGSQTPPCP